MASQLCRSLTPTPPLLLARKIGDDSLPITPLLPRFVVCVALVRACVRGLVLRTLYPLPRITWRGISLPRPLTLLVGVATTPGYYGCHLLRTAYCVTDGFGAPSHPFPLPYQLGLACHALCCAFIIVLLPCMVGYPLPASFLCPSDSM